MRNSLRFGQRSSFLAGRLLRLATHSNASSGLLDELVRFRQGGEDDEAESKIFSLIEDTRAGFLNDATRIEFGVKRRFMQQVSVIASTAPKPVRHAQFIHRLVERLSPIHALELGTCLGLTSQYIASALPENGRLITLEGSADVADQAEKGWAGRPWAGKTQLVRGDFDDTFGPVLEALPRLDFAFIDFDHRYEETMKSFHMCLSKAHAGTVMLFDDIYWSWGMLRAWREIERHPSVALTVDLLFMGLVYLKKGISDEPRTRFSLG